MADPTADDVVKSVELELKVFGKRAKPKLTLLGDLRLSLDAAKTPEVRKLLGDMQKKMMAELVKDANDANKRLQRHLAQLEKQSQNAQKAKNGGAGCKTDDAAKAKQTKVKIKVCLDKFSKQLFPNNLSLHVFVAAKPKPKFPFLDYKEPVFGIGGTY